MNETLFLDILNKAKAVISKLTEYESICVCGSSKFADLIAVAKWELEKAGFPCTGLNLLPDWYMYYAKLQETHHIAEQEKCAHALDEVHLRKILMCEAVLVFNYNGYIGERTSIEIEYAKQHNKPIYYWQDLS